MFSHANTTPRQRAANKRVGGERAPLVESDDVVATSWCWPFFRRSQVRPKAMEAEVLMRADRVVDERAHNLIAQAKQLAETSLVPLLKAEQRAGFRQQLDEFLKLTIGSLRPKNNTERVIEIKQAISCNFGDAFGARFQIFTEQLAEMIHASSSQPSTTPATAKF
tara:strand:- start:2259 stop:2753 length:495 start_codon:yes stop_codon:yes gene_type:complete